MINNLAYKIKPNHPYSLDESRKILSQLLIREEKNTRIAVPIYVLVYKTWTATWNNPDEKKMKIRFHRYKKNFIDKNMFDILYQANGIALVKRVSREGKWNGWEIIFLPESRLSLSLV